MPKGLPAGAGDGEETHVCRCFGGGTDVLPKLSAGETSGSFILHILEPVQGFALALEKDSIAAVQAEVNKCMN